MLRRNIVALIGLLAVINGSKWLFDGKRLPTLALDQWYLLHQNSPQLKRQPQLPVKVV